MEVARKVLEYSYEIVFIVKNVFDFSFILVLVILRQKVKALVICPHQSVCQSVRKIPEL